MASLYTDCKSDEMKTPLLKVSDVQVKGPRTQHEQGGNDFFPCH